MTVRELYDSIGGDYEAALRTLRMEKLIDKHIRKLTKNGVVENLLEAEADLDPTRIFEAAHALKGVGANLGLLKLAEAAAELTEEFRPGRPRQLTDDQVRERFAALRALYEKTAAGIREYEG